MFFFCNSTFRLFVGGKPAELVIQFELRQQRNCLPFSCIPSFFSALKFGLLLIRS